MGSAGHRRLTQSLGRVAVHGEKMDSGTGHREQKARLLSQGLQQWLTAE